MSSCSGFLLLHRASTGVTAVRRALRGRVARTVVRRLERLVPLPRRSRYASGVGRFVCVS